MIAERPRVGSSAGSLCGTTDRMAVLSPHQIMLTDGQRRLLLARARRVSGEHRDVVRARIVLAAADGVANAAIARDLGVNVDTVRKWRRRFCEQGLDACVICRGPDGPARSPPPWLPR